MRSVFTERKIRILFSKSHQQLLSISIWKALPSFKRTPPTHILNNAKNKGSTIVSLISEFLSNPKASHSSSKRNIFLFHQSQKIILQFPCLLLYEICSLVWYGGMLEYIVHEIWFFSILVQVWVLSLWPTVWETVTHIYSRVCFQAWRARRNKPSQPAKHMFSSIKKKCVQREG